MLNLSKKPIQNDPIIKAGEVITLGIRKYIVKFTEGLGFYLSGIACSNDMMFHDLHIESKRDWCEAHNIDANFRGTFPYMDGPNLLHCIKVMKNMFFMKELPF